MASPGLALSPSRDSVLRTLGGCLFPPPPAAPPAAGSRLPWTWALPCVAVRVHTLSERGSQRCPALLTAACCLYRQVTSRSRGRTPGSPRAEQPVAPRTLTQRGHRSHSRPRTCQGQRRRGRCAPPWAPSQAHPARWAWPRAPAGPVCTVSTGVFRVGGRGRGRCVQSPRACAAPGQAGGQV